MHFLTPIYRLFFASLFLLICLELQGCAAAAVSGAATSVALVNDRRTVGTILEDQSIELKGLHAVSRNPNLWKPSHISIVSYNTSVLLLGQTPSPHLKEEAENLIKEIPRVQKVYNELTIGSPVPLATRSKDSWITAQIKGKMVSAKTVNPTRIKVITEKGIVYLMGLTTPNEQAAATDIARRVPGVQKVVQIFETT